MSEALWYKKLRDGMEQIQIKTIQYIQKTENVWRMYLKRRSLAKEDTDHELREANLKSAKELFKKELDEVT